jgi:hypothetical protein
LVSNIKGSKVKGKTLPPDPAAECPQSQLRRSANAARRSACGPHSKRRGLPTSHIAVTQGRTAVSARPAHDDAGVIYAAGIVGDNFRRRD